VVRIVEDIRYLDRGAPAPIICAHGLLRYRGIPGNRATFPMRSETIVPRGIRSLGLARENPVYGGLSIRGGDRSISGAPPGCGPGSRSGSNGGLRYPEAGLPGACRLD